MNMINHKSILFLAGLLGTVSASAQTPDSLAANQKLATAVLWTRTSGEYRALNFQAYNFAKLSLENALKNRDITKPAAVVVDIDETVLDNSAYYEHALKEKRALTWDNWKNWLLTQSADTVPGAVGFLKYAASRNVAVFYVTNREEIFNESTLKDLKKYGFPNADPAHYFPSKGDYNKDPRREAIAATHHILLFAGDNLSDFTSLFYNKENKAKAYVDENRDLFGTKFIVLPNSLYGGWKKKGQ
jgi:5'-nucleotidase (lipoprotein e(P4) family)